MLRRLLDHCSGTWHWNAAIGYLPVTKPRAISMEGLRLSVRSSVCSSTCSSYEYAAAGSLFRLAHELPELELVMFTSLCVQEMSCCS
jgi:hypothetical protein